MIERERPMPGQSCGCGGNKSGNLGATRTRVTFLLAGEVYLPNGSEKRHVMRNFFSADKAPIYATVRKPAQTTTVAPGMWGTMKRNHE